MANFTKKIIDEVIIKGMKEGPGPITKSIFQIVTKALDEKKGKK
ncbi:hypothetical protein [Flammeovirga sp. SubArs3]|nr:hypothetical protein [Flammeovirga sp. SubArs3]